MHRLTLGDCELTILSDGTYQLDGGAMFGVVPKTLWEKRIKADERNLLTLGLNSLLIRDGKQTVLVETGIGPKLNDKSREIHRNQMLLMESFREAGVSPSEIDVVINTHLHFDHCGWNTHYKDGKPEPTFPNATYYAQQGELEHAHEQHERDRVSYLTDNYDPLVQSGQMRALRGSAEIAPGISVEVYPGHTRNLQAVTLRAGDQTVCYISDLIPTSHHLDRRGLWDTIFILWSQSTIAIASTSVRFRRSGWWCLPTTMKCRGLMWRSGRRASRWPSQLSTDFFRRY